jgi:glycosyltransferase involved in cell wall biosynthesis
VRKGENHNGSMFLTACLITYNHKEYIAQALESVLSQKTAFTFDIVVADDFSTDGTREILLNYKNLYPDRIHLILQSKNIGPGNNWKDLITFSKSKYIAYLECDDYWTDSNKLQKQVDALEQNKNCNICCTRAESLYNGDFILQPFPDNHRRIFEYSDLISIKNFINSATLLYRNILKEPFPDWFLKVPFGDLGLYMLLTRQSKIIYLEDVTAVYRVHPNGAWSGLSQIDKLEREFIYHQLIANHYTENENEIVETRLSNVINEWSQIKYENNFLKRLKFSFQKKKEYKYARNAK